MHTRCESLDREYSVICKIEIEKEKTKDCRLLFQRSSWTRQEAGIEKDGSLFITFVRTGVPKRRRLPKIVFKSLEDGGAEANV